MTRARKASIILCVITFCSTINNLGYSRGINVPGDFSCLTQALKKAVPGDRILLAPGQYDVNGLSLVESVALVGSIDDPGSVVLHGCGQGYVLRAESLQDVHLSGLTITGGLASGDDPYSSSGGGILVSNSNIRMDNVHFIGNQSETSGGAMRICRGSLIAVDCLFEDNHALKGGGAIDLSYGAAASLERVRFVSNSAAWGGAASVRYSSSFSAVESHFIDNHTITPQEYGGALFSDRSATVSLMGCLLAGNSARQGGSARLGGLEATITSCTIVANTAWETGGAFMVTDSRILLNRSIVSFNEGAALSGSSIDLSCTATNIYGNTGGDWTGILAPLRPQHGNMGSDPLFCEIGDYRLEEESPCAPENNPTGLIGAMPVGCEDVGLFLQAFTATQENQRVELAWSVAPGSYDFRLTGQAADHPEFGAWQVPHTAAQIPGRYTAGDTPPAVAGSLLYRLAVHGADDSWQLIGEIRIDLSDSLPTAPLTLDRVYPNPFNPKVNIQYTLPRPASVRAAIYDLHGRLIDRFVVENQPSGSHLLVWDGHDHLGRSLPTGTYLLRLDSGGNERTAKLMLIK